MNKNIIIAEFDELKNDDNIFGNINSDFFPMSHLKIVFKIWTLTILPRNLLINYLIM